MRPKNKFERNLVKKNKLKNRVKNIHGNDTYEKFVNNELVDVYIHVYGDTTKPCSCSMCSRNKYKRKKFIDDE